MTSKHSLKLWLCVACLATSLAAPALQQYQYQPLEMDIIDLAAISRMSPQQLESLAEGLAAQEMMRTKRSSAAALTSVVSKASGASSSGIGSKVGLLGQASAGAVSFIASASSKSGHNDEHGYNYEPHDSKVDYWGLKKSILYTLFQAVKAITGGVTILKGQLIKGGGALASTLGKVISVKGDAVSNLGKKIVSSAALSHKPHSTAVYGPPPPAHIEYAPSGYGAPTAPAHYSHIAPSAPTGYAAHKYPAPLDGRSKLNGVHAGLVILTPLAETNEVQHVAATAHHTPLEPPSSLLHSAFSAIKNVFSSAAPSYPPAELHEQPPPPQPAPPFRPMTWGAVNSYGEPATVDSFTDYDPRNQHQSFDYASSKKSSVPKIPSVQQHGLTPEKLHKISANLDKLAHMQLQRSSEELPRFDAVSAYRQLLQGARMPFLPTPVVSDAELGVLPAELLSPEPPSPSPMTTTTTTTTTTPAPPTTTTQPSEEKTRRRKDVKYILRGNKIVVV
ncbi:SKI family transcriptional corepressor 2 isoform X1 [Plutella xylostella]|uniref:SKI family transcriptional corepressor 2 isoform X1 n=1 Tax=Plutella xylostella TaxID=51655 RepID=UPI002032376C|nr:SKI family transcriptional corepressor 2 isoform X1 [Plutella xylostella]